MGTPEKTPVTFPMAEVSPENAASFADVIKGVTGLDMIFVTTEVSVELPEITGEAK